MARNAHHINTLSPERVTRVGAINQHLKPEEMAKRKKHLSQEMTCEKMEDSFLFLEKSLNYYNY